MKPFKGCIQNWEKQYFSKALNPGLPNNLGFIIKGKPVGHPEFTGWIRTSAVVHFGTKEGDDIIETLNSRYQLLDKRKET